MAICKNCGKPLIPYGGKCVYCGANLVTKKETIEQQKWLLRKYSVDIVFCVDGTCSMVPVLESIKENIIGFIDVCENSHVDWRARIVVFRDSEVDKEWLENDNPFVSSKKDLVTQLGTIKVKGNVEDEQDASSIMDALFYASTKSDWRNIRFPWGPMDSDYDEFVKSGGCYGFMFIVGFTDAKTRPYLSTTLEKIEVIEDNRKKSKSIIKLMRYDMIDRQLVFAPKDAGLSERPIGKYCQSIVKDFDDPIEFYYHNKLDFSPIYSVLSRTYS